MCLAYIIVAVATEIVAYDRQSQNLHNQLRTRAASDALILAQGAAGLSSEGNTGLLKNFVQSMTQASGVTYAVVYDQFGHEIAWTPAPRPPFRIHMPATLPPSADLSNGDVRGAAPVSNGLSTLGEAEVI